MITMESDRLAINLLEAVAVAQVAGEPLDVAGLAAKLTMDPPELQREIEDAVAAGLMLVGDQRDAVPLLLDAGRQYLGRDGRVPEEVLRFLPRTIDDLNARQALLEGGSLLVHEFRAALIDGSGIEHAADLVPPAFAAAIDKHLALDLYAAAVAVMARLSAGDHPGCVGEEIVAVQLLEEARTLLERDAEKGKLTEQEVAGAVDELRGLLGLFVDDEVLAMFEMDEPADAAVAEHGRSHRRQGEIHRRVEAWFRPFDGTVPTGYLTDRTDDVSG
jgi:hypothetical protein